MIPPLPLRIREPQLEISNQSRRDLIEFEEGEVAAGAGVVAETELGAVSYMGEEQEWERGLTGMRYFSRVLLVLGSSQRSGL